tara:strand:+ start:2714 stop:3094 length:381 start_codon:yes stop_codon:yes gene_type:complete
MKVKYPQKIFRAIKQVETGGHPDPEHALGAAGEYGPYQITEQYWLDAIEYSDLGGKYEDVSNEWYAQLVMIAYFERYCKNDSLECLARTHNGGPQGEYKTSTDSYWFKIKEALNAEDDIRYRDKRD